MGNIDPVRAKVQSILAERFTVELTSNGGYSLRHESAQLFVELVDQETRVLVKLTCPVLFKVKATPEMFEHIALHADDYYFGHLSAFRTEDGASIYFTHVLLGDYLDSEELIQVVVALLQGSNSLDDELQGIFGGQRYHED